MSSKPKISEDMAKAMKIVAVFFDILGAAANLAFAIGSTIVNILAYILFTFWFVALGINPLEMKRAKRMGISAMFEVIPGVNIVPAISVMVWMVIALEKKEFEKKQEKEIEVDNIIRLKRSDEEQRIIEQRMAMNREGEEDENIVRRKRAA